MYDRSPRFKELKTATPAGVGPDTYIIPYTIRYENKQNHVPFLFSDYIGKSFEVSKHVAEEPGPANYYPQTPVKHIPGGSTVRNTATRFRYEPDEPEVPPIKVRRPHKIPGKIRKGRVSFSSGPSGVSVPQCYGYYGYTKKPDGTWVKVQVPEPDHTLGPAFYHVKPGEMNFTTLSYKGIVFANKSFRTTSLRPKEGPGPAAYDIREKQPSLAEMQNEEIRFWKRSTCKVLRYTEQIERTNLRENTPGPNHYSYPLVKPREPKGKVKGAFWSSQSRFAKERREKRPGPADYLGQRSPVIKKPGSMLDAPFLFMAPRFPLRMDAQTPGPASYEVKGLTDARKGPSKWATWCAAFDSSAPRKFTFLERGTKTPAPNEYFIKYQSCQDDRRSAVFKSACERFEEPRKDVRPEALDYKAIEAQKRLLTPTSHRLKHGDLQAPFLQTTRRFGRIVNAPKQNVVTDNPPPGAYTPCDVQCTVTSGSMSTSARFKEEIVQQPGPTEYTINPAIAQSCVKGTFNVTLDNPLPQYVDKRRVPWDIRIKGHKFLKWFAQGGSLYYKHCWEA